MNPYNFETHIAEIYDALELQNDDVVLLEDLVANIACKRILEPFCGTGRIMLPLLSKGYEMTGIDESRVMLDALEAKMCSYEEKEHAKVIHSDVLTCDWGEDYDLVILGNNCFFELSDLDKQKNVLKKAYEALRPGGYLFIDNDNVEGDLPDHWCHTGEEISAFPSGTCIDGTELKGYMRPIYVDKKEKIWRANRRLEVIKNAQVIGSYSWTQQKHPVGYSEIADVLSALNMTILNVWDTYDKGEFDPDQSKRAIIWARKE